MANDCSCKRCVAACREAPGMFLPGEAEKVAAHLHVPLARLFREKIMVDYWYENGVSTVYALTPAIKGVPAGGEFPEDKRFGECIFLDGDSCTIHEVKPHECREYTHDTTREEHDALNEKMRAAWEPERDNVERFLGRPPRRIWRQLRPWEGW